MRILKTIVLSGFLMLTGCENRPSLPTSSTFDVARHAGVWRSQGYGYVMKVDADGMNLFDVNQKGCVTKAIDSADIASHMAIFSDINKDHIVVSPTNHSTQYHFDRLDGEKAKAVLANCMKASNKKVMDNFEYFSQTMAEHYAFFDVYEQDWAKIVSHSRGKITANMSEEALFTLFSDMLKDLDDAHLFLTGEVNGSAKRFSPNQSRILRPALDAAYDKQQSIDNPRAFRRHWYESYKTQVRSSILKDSANDIGQFIIWGTIDNVGYINLQRMQGFSDSGSIQDDVAAIRKAMDVIMASLEQTDAVIIDITANGGGHDEVGLAIARYFNSQRRVAYSKSAKGGPQPSQVFYLESAFGKAYTKPVYLVTSDHTVSAAETFTMAMRSIPHVTHVGDTTRGAHSDILDKTLPNGWNLGLSNEVYTDADGEISEGRGLVPEWKLPVFGGADVFTSHTQAIASLMTRVKTPV